VGEETLDTSVPSRASEPEVVMQEDIFFDFDKATLSAAAREILTKNGEWLRIESDVFITIEGHCDERGTNDYNLALGDRRAESVKTFLTDLGIDRSRMTTISYGEEHPSVPGHSESDWANNRRAHFSIR
jgi:peptidoglycan-associated lipoprotein